MAARMKVVLAMMFTVLALYTVRLMYLQLVMGQEYVVRSEQNATQEQRIQPLRGRILARDGTVLADDRVAYDLLYRGGEIYDWDRLRALLGLTGEPRPPDRTKPEEVQHGAVLAWNIPDELVPAIEERVALNPNLVLRERIERTYPTNLAAQTVGLPLESQVRGALVALDPRTGEILAMASHPTFDQNVFTHRPSDPEQVTAILTDGTNMPLANRAVEAYAPASTFKVVTSSTLLENGYVTPRTAYSCSARFRYGGITWENWATYDKGSYTVREAIADSCNTYFWNAAVNTPDFSVGWAPFIEDLVERAREFGFGRPVGIGLLEEKAGRVPDRDWVRAQPQYGHGWLPGFTLNTVIGQGDVLATPVQIAQFISTLALNGTMVQPHLVKRIGDQEVEPVVTQVDGRFWSTLTEGMRAMFTDFPSRTIMGPGVFPMSVAGKSGTAQTPRGGDYTHAWFMGFSPVEEPRIAVVVFIEYGGSSSRVSVPVARDFLAGYWSQQGVEVAANP